jgi:pectate lyase-like protein
MDCRYVFLIVLLFLLAEPHASAQKSLFYGQFKSWANLKLVYGAVGDGSHDDTQALQSAINDLGNEGHSPVLYIPAGTYRITKTLTMQTRTGIGIIGEDPENTTIKWDGAAGMKMFALNGVSYSEYSRLTWDGNNKALVAVAHEWDGKVRYANSGTQHSDEVFKNIGVGLKSGSNMDAEFAIKRCRFYNCSSTGISLQGYNALDWWVWDCYFDSCNNGVANNSPANGAGNFHVYRSIFKNSAHADISLGNSEFFSFRDNISYNSNCFITASQWSNTSPITLQGNTIISNKDNVMVNLFTKGNVLLLDNTFIMPDSGKNYVVDISDGYRTPPADFTLIGNIFTRKQKTYASSGGGMICIDNKTAAHPNKNMTITPVPFAKLAGYLVLEVNNKMNTDEIQSAIDKAVRQKTKTLIHFSYGKYSISKTLRIPGNAEIILFGDGLSSILTWAGESNNAMIEISSPAKATMQNLYLNGNNKADCLLIYDNDKPGNSIYGDELLLYHGVQTNLFVNAFSKTDFRFDNFQHNYCNAGTSIKLIGTGDKNASVAKVFGGESSNTGNSYSIAKGARILLYDIWYENALTSRFLTLSSNGEFILNGSKIANTNAAHEPFIDIDSFSGKVVLSEVIFNSPKKTIYFNDKYGNASFLALGNLNWTDSTNNFFNVHSKAGSYAMMNNRQNTGRGSYPLPNFGDTSSNFIIKMLTTLRQTRVSEKPVTKSQNNSDFIMRRMMVDGGINNVRIERSIK